MSTPICQHCGQEYDPDWLREEYPGSNWWIKKYCSPDCALKANKAYLRAMPEETVKITIPFPAEIHGFLVSEAHKNQRSLTGQLLWILGRVMVASRE